MIFYIEKISISRDDLLKNQENQLLREIMNETIQNQVESLLCEIITKIINNEGENRKNDCY
jgi:hypothetical protein